MHNLIQKKKKILINFKDDADLMLWEFRETILMKIMLWKR